MKLNTVLTDAKKALGALTVGVASAVGFGFLDSAEAGLITGGIGVASAVVVYLLDNEKPAR